MGGEKMGYGVKWVEDNLGVSRKALRVLEENGLMPQNESGSYRDYTDEDIEYIWRIKTLQGMGYSLKEISSMADALKNDKDIDFNSSIAEKIKQLEAEKERVEKSLGYLYAIKSSGRFPARPKEMGTITFEEFREKSLNEWNVNNDPVAKQCQEILDKLLNTSEDELEATDLGKILVLFQELQFGVQNSEKYLADLILPKAIVNRKHLGVTHPEIQLLVKLIYENRIEILPELKNMTLNQFVRFESSSYISGDIALFNQRKYGKVECEFIANAIAVFGGYSSYEAID